MSEESNAATAVSCTPYSEGCQIKCVPKFATEPSGTNSGNFIVLIKSILRLPWNLYLKQWMKKMYYSYIGKGTLTQAQKRAKAFSPVSAFVNGDPVRVRSREEILATLDPFGELKGCTFFTEMYNYCGTEQRVFKVMRHFMDERDYRFKKTRGIILLENIFCRGNSAFGECDRCCFLFWWEEWLEKL